MSAFTEIKGEGQELRNKQKREDGTPYRIRTCDLRLRRPVLYPTELRAHWELRRIIRCAPAESTIYRAEALCCCTIEQSVLKLCLTAASASDKIGTNPRINSTQMDPLSDGSKDY